MDYKKLEGIIRSTWAQVYPLPDGEASVVVSPLRLYAAILHNYAAEIYTNPNVQPAKERINGFKAALLDYKGTYKANTEYPFTTRFLSHTTELSLFPVGGAEAAEIKRLGGSIRVYNKGKFNRYITMTFKGDVKL